MEKETIDLLVKNGYSLTILLLLVFIGYILTHIDKILLLQSSFFGWLAKFSSRAKKKQLSKGVRGTILKSTREKIVSNPNVLPNDLQIVWVDKEEPETFVTEEQVIIRIKQSSNPHENLVTAVSEYVNNGLLYNVRRYLNDEVLNASKILITRKIIQSSSKNALTYLDENYIKPKFDKDSELKELYEDLLRIDHNGMFEGILLNEFHKAGMSIYGSIEDPELIAESKEFMRFLYNIAIGLSNDPEQLTFNRDYFKVSIFLTASNKTLHYAGIQPFVNKISQRLNENIETIYIFGLGTKRDTARQIANESKNDYRILSVRPHHYKHIADNGKRVLGVYYECSIYEE